MTTTTSNTTGSTRTPPQLNYLVIYNPTLTPSHPLEADQDEDDAIEQSHILFYTPRERAVSRDRMLRQVGLAKALNNFAGMFSPGEGGCDAIHSQKKRMIMIQPEKDFWIHASVDVARSPRSSTPSKSSTSKGKGKGREDPKDKAKVNISPFEFHESSLLDDVLRTHLLRGYTQFKLLHGSLNTLLQTSGQAQLERLLDRFWTVWAWQWDVESPPDFGKHLGLSLRPSPSFVSHLSSSNLIDSPNTPSTLQNPPPLPSPISQLYSLAPADCIPLVLSLVPPALLPLRPSQPYPPAALADHLLSIIPPPRPRARSMSSSVSTIGPNTIRQQSSSQDLRNASATDSNTSANAASFMPHLNLSGLGGAMNPKKWGWGSLSMKKIPGIGLGGLGLGGTTAGESPRSGSADPETSRPPSTDSTSASAVRPPSAPSNGNVLAETQNDKHSEPPDPSKGDGGVTPTPTIIHLHPEQPLLAPQPTVAVNHDLLEDAMSVHESIHNDTPPRPQTPTTPDLTPRPVDPSSSLPLAEEELPSSNGDTSESTPAITLLPLEHDSPPTTPTPPPSLFHELWIHMDRSRISTTEVEQTLPSLRLATGSPQEVSHTPCETEKRKVLYLSRDRLAFAIVLAPDQLEVDVSLASPILNGDDLDKKIHLLLGEIGETLEIESLESEKALTGQTADAKNQSSNTGDSSSAALSSSSTRWVIRSDLGGAVADDGTQSDGIPLRTSSPGFQTNSPHYFGMRSMMFNPHSSILEVISRSQNLRWFAGKRAAHLDSKSLGAEGEVYVEIGRKDASLVDVDYEVDRVIISNRN